jgi:hypothetical protein
MNRFRMANGDFKALADMSNEEKIAFTMANAMKKIIENLEISISNERVFNRAKFNAMQVFHSAFDEINALKAGNNE